MTAPLLRVAIQERQRLYRDALGTVIEAEADLTVVASAATPGELLSAVDGVEVDVVLTDAVAFAIGHGLLATAGTQSGDAA
jgi:DNA-binding NarL/FixJ family response regulator